MSDLVIDHQFSNQCLQVPTEALFEAEVGLGQEIETAPQTTFAQAQCGCDIQWTSGMSHAPTYLSDIIVERLEEVPEVAAIMIGRSGEIYHVWSMIEPWNHEVRKSVYSAQKELLKMLKGFELDFYVVPLEEGTDPSVMVTQIPTVFQRASGRQRAI
jgi:hypothetical protein